MPGRNDIATEITSNDRQDVVRRRYLSELSKHTGRNTIIYSTAFTCKKVQLQQLPGMLLSVTPEDIQGFMASIHDLQGDQLDLILHS
ncbi:MAG TPA: serine protease, partial [Clostridia bacterium]|nr:serine protease [Clostridia bacterium]